MSSHVPDWSDYVEFKKGAIAAEATRKIDEYVKRGFKRFNIPLDYGVNSAKMYRYGYFGKQRGSQRRRLRVTNVSGSSRPTKRARAVQLASIRGPRKGQNVGHPVGTSTCKRAIVQGNWNISSVPTYFSEAEALQHGLTGIEQASATSNAINLRQRQIINCVGFDMRFYMRNALRSAALVFNLVLVAPRQHAAALSGGFFRGYKDKREQDFPIAQEADGNVLNMTPINTDDYNILWKKQITLGPDTDVPDGASPGNGYFDRTLPNWKSFKQWIPINRQLRYAGGEPNSCEDPMYLMYWVCRPDKRRGEAPAADCALIQHETVMYFKEPGTA